MGVGEVVERLGSADVESMSVAEVTAAMRDVARVESWAAGVAARLASRADDLAASGHGASGAEALGADRRMSRRDAARVARRGEVLRSLPEMTRLLEKGRIGPEHVDVVAGAAHRVGATTRDALFALDGRLAATAAGARPEEFRRFVGRLMDRLRPDARRERAVRQRNSVRLTRGVDRESGMYWLRGEFDPETGARVFAALDAEVAARSAADDGRERRPQEVGETPDAERLGAEALADLVTSAGRARRPGRAEVSVLVDLATLTGGLHASTVCETEDGSPLPVEAVRRLSCDADVLPVVLGGAGVPLDVGRSRRQATAAQRRALRTMYRTCGVDGCDAEFPACEMHHVVEWKERSGPTDLANLVPLCRRHHHLAHEGRWRLELEPVGRVLSVWLPDGTLHGRCRPDLVAERTAGRAA